MRRDIYDNTVKLNIEPFGRVLQSRVDNERGYDTEAVVENTKYEVISW